VSAQPFAAAYLYLSQIPYTGLDLGPIGTVVYWIALVGWSLALAYIVLFGVAPIVNRRIRNFGSRVSALLNVPELSLAREQIAPVMPSLAALPAARQDVPEAARGYSPYDGFKSFAHNGVLSVEDIVRGLSKESSAAAAEHVAEPTEPAEPEVPMEPPAPVENISLSVRDFASALVAGDRAAVFAGLRQHLRNGGTPEQLINATVCFFDDAYRARVDGTACDSAMERLIARLNTPMLEKLIAALTTAIDSSYSTGVTGAKLALTRALATLGA